MIIRSGLAALFVLGVAAAPVLAQSAPPRLDAAVPDWMEAARVPAVAIARIEDGAVIWTRVYGERAPGAAADETTVFNVASLTKPLFGVMALHLVADGRLDPDGRLADDWVDPDIAGDDRLPKLTPRIALSHQTGFENWRGARPLAFTFSPGERHQYSGEGFEYLRRALERRTGRTMPELMQAHVLDAAGMSHTAFGWSAAFESRAATGFDETGQTYDMSDRSERQANAAANTFTTVGDYGRFVAWVAEGADLPGPLFAAMATPQALHDNPTELFGLGWKLAPLGDRHLLWHDGREPGVRTLAFADPRTGDGLVVLTNSSNGELVMRAIVSAATDDGDAWMDSLDAETWRYLQSLPGAQLGQILQVIARSPSFVSKLLYAADTTLIEASPLSVAEKSEARAAIDPFVLAMVRGEVDRPRLESLLSTLIDTDGGQPRLHDRLTREQALAWKTGLDLSAAPAAAPAPEAPALRPVVEVAPEVLADYAGDYLVPSSNLRITISVAGDHLQATAEGIPTVGFYPVSQTRFFMRESATDFDFVRDATGAVTGMTIIWDNSRSEFATRVE